MQHLLVLAAFYPIGTAYPSYLDCDAAKSRLEVGQTIMGNAVQAAPGSAKMEVLRSDGKTASNYIEGEMLLLHITGDTSGSLAVVRSNDETNSTLYTQDYSSATGLWKSQCSNQLYNPQGTPLAGSAYVCFRPGCSNGSSQALEFKLGYGPSFGPVKLATMQLPSANKKDASCNGGPLPPCPTKPESPADVAARIAKYNTLISVHRWCVTCSWGFFFPLGVTLVRYYPGGKRLNLHRVAQTIGLLIEIVDFSCVYSAHNIGAGGKGPSDAHFSGTQGSAPSVTHKQRGLCVFICILLQVVLGIVRPKPFPNTFLRRIWLWTHRTVGDGAMVVAWIQIWEAVSLLPDMTTLRQLAIVSCLFVASAAVVAPAYYMLVLSRPEKDPDGTSVADPSHEVSIDNSLPSTVENEHPRDTNFFGCGYCNQVFTSKHILETHIKYSHPEQEYKEICTPMTQRYADAINNPATTAGITLSEVKRHNSRQDCWVVLHGKVYDLTKFLSTHPGGPDPILSWAGRDATRTWNLIHQKPWLTQYPAVVCLGPLAPEPPVEGLLTEGIHRRNTTTVDPSRGDGLVMSNLQTGLVSAS